MAEMTHTAAMDEPMEPDSTRLQMPQSVLAAAEPLTAAFYALKTQFRIGNSFSFGLADIHVDLQELSAPESVAAFAMRRIQLFCYIARRDAVTRTGHVMSQIEQITAQLEQLQKHCTARRRETLVAAVTALDQASRGVTELLAFHEEALGGLLDVELGPSVVPETPAGIDRY